jgi:hypothetical protein
MYAAATHRSGSLIVAYALLALVLAGCSNATTTSSSGTTSTSPTAPSTATAKPALTNLSDYCNLVTPAEVAHATGLSVMLTTPGVANDERHEVVCGYAQDTTSSVGAVIIYIISPTAAQAQSTFAALKQQAQSRGATVAPVSGIGDQAFSTVQNGANGVEAVKGAVVFLASGTTPHPISLAAATALARLVASKL